MKFHIGFLTLILSSFTMAGVYEGKVTKIQAEGDGEPYNTLYLDLDIADSTCDSTNVSNRLTLISDFQKSVALAAMMADKTVIVGGSGVCKSQIEEINFLQIIK